MVGKRNDDDLFLDMSDDDLISDDLMGDGAQATTDDAKTPAQDDFFEDTVVPGQAAVYVYETKESIIVMAPMPGVEKGDVDLSLVENTLTIRGDRKKPAGAGEGTVYADELHWGDISRSIVLPVQVREEGSEAVLKDGMLTVTVPKAEQEKIKKIEVQ